MTGQPRIVIGAWTSPYRLAGVLAFGDTIAIDVRQRKVWRGQSWRLLSPTGLRIASMLIGSGGRIVPKDELFDALHAEHVDGGPLGGPRSLDVHIWRCRQKLAPLGIFFLTHHWRGVQALFFEPLGAAITRAA